MAENGEQAEIVYDDPGSVTDIRKKFGIQTKSDFITPKKFSLRFEHLKNLIGILKNIFSSFNIFSFR